MVAVSFLRSSDIDGLEELLRPPSQRRRSGLG